MLRHPLVDDGTINNLQRRRSAVFDPSQSPQRRLPLGRIFKPVRYLKSTRRNIGPPSAVTDADLFASPSRIGPT
jgi:hypothetical protein